ncbi:hypothetical protein LWC34_08975 [Kibdelosporangium philippinense]|uniref:Uncharacterized protein n=1 Tax=Kibdelosporangium philippinense TaxID=211113 RepID=A0ABS8Z562_9PSEU|nr:hypothetical protein [Kibdelosporangium philippinense]MCE7002960.1 hypothetical protein [Kibdelosporangium philippinense]
MTQRNAEQLLVAVATHHAVSERVVRGHPELNDARLSDPHWAPLLSGLG